MAARSTTTVSNEDRDRAVIALIGHCGLKPGELTGDDPLEVGDVNLEAREITIRPEVATVGDGARVEVETGTVDALEPVVSDRWPDEPVIDISSQAIRNIVRDRKGCTPSELRREAAADALEDGRYVDAAEQLRLSNPTVAAGDLRD